VFENYAGHRGPFLRGSRESAALDGRKMAIALNLICMRVRLRRDVLDGSVRPSGPGSTARSRSAIGAGDQAWADRLE
jgi:hypothetical protein